MKTLLRSETKEIHLDTEGPIVIIGEKINPTGHKKLATAYKDGDFKYVRALASRQIAAGADVLDINVGVPGMDEVAMLPEVVKIVASEVEAPLCLDSANPDVLAAALPLTPGKPLINSVNGEEASLNSLLPIVKDHNAAVIGLTMDDEGIPNDAETRLAIAGKILERAAKLGIPIEDVVIDPLVMAVGADSHAAVVTIRAIQLIRQEFGVNINLGASNVSFGLPERQTINEAFLALAVSAGATCVITDPMKHTLTIRAIDMLLGRDEYATRYIGHYRALAKGSN
ncbi:MAG TPA: dihydropteroate synthase [Anaerolineae bacterium]|nr:dihydropteroate synthase [Anaerolineae bacterium]